ncbi:MAG: hypothetical protein E7213_11650 [Clostridium sp.]|nr:hypothetical protein [Clostridium sp.]
MDFDFIRRKIINNKFSLSYKNGEKLFQEGKVEIVDIKDIENIIYIYGRVKDKTRIYSTFIKFHKQGKILKLSCNCELNEEARRAVSSFACSHIIATVLKLSNNEHLDNNKTKDGVTLSILLEDSFKDDYLYNVSLYLKDRSRIRISDKADLEYNILNDKAVYSFRRINYTKADKALIKKINKLNFKIKDEDVREFLFLSRFSNVKAKINSMEYNTPIIIKELPLRFTLKMEGSKVKLQRRKDTIISLNKAGTAFIFNDEIYLPPFKQCKAFALIYSILKDKYFTYVKKSSLKKVIKILSSIGELSIHDEVKDILAAEEDIDLYFSKENSTIWCEFLNKKNYINGATRIKAIEEKLYLYGFTKKGDKYIFTRDDEDLFQVLKGDIGILCNIKSSKQLGNFNIVSIDNFKGKIIEQDNKLFFDLDFQGNKDEIFNAIESFRAGQKFYKFKDSSFLDFTDIETREYMKFLSFVNFTGDKLNIQNGYEELFYEQGRKFDFIELIKKNQIIQQDVKSPKGLKGTLREYQLEGMRWLQNKKDNDMFGILADEMGLGKTVQTISFLLNNKGDLSMIIAPTSLVYNWVNEFKKFAPRLKVACVHGSKSKRENFIKNIKDYDVIVTSYGSINMDIDLYSDIKFDNLILDEGQTIKNPKSKISMNVKKLNSECRFVLTGTPLENNLMELWSIFDFLQKDYLFSEGEFKRKFKANNEEEIKYLKLLIKPFILRRTKKEVLKELPNKNEEIAYVDMTKEQKDIYKNSIKIFKKKAENMDNSISILALLTKLREIALDPCLIDKNYKGGSGKVNEVINIIKASVKQKKKILVFSQFTGMLDILKNQLDNSKIKYYYLDGSTKADERIRLCEEFNKKKRIKVFLISLKAGGTGLNLTSAETVIHFDPWWNPAVENQATDRAHRIGQQNQVEVIKIISKGTIEEKILRLKQEKSKMISELLSSNDNNALSKTTLTKEEINYLISYEDV